MSATIIDLRTRRPLLTRVGDPCPFSTDYTLRRVAAIGSVRGMPEPDCRTMAAHALRRLREGQSHADVIDWARGYVRDFLRHWPGPGAA